MCDTEQISIFCENNGIKEFDRSATMQLQFDSNGENPTKGLLLGIQTKSGKLAVWLGPEIPKIFMVDPIFMLKFSSTFPEDCEYIFPDYDLVIIKLKPKPEYLP